MNDELKHDTRNKKYLKLYNNIWHHIPHCLKCHSDKYFQIKVKQRKYNKIMDFSIKDFHYQKVKKLKNANILL